MVKSPRIRHSKPRRDPVTIDLEASEVDKAPAKAEAAKDSQTSASRPAAGGSSSVKTDAEDTAKETPRHAESTLSASQPETATSSSASAARYAAKPTPGEAAAAKPAPGGSSSAASPAFGRDAGKPSATPPPGATPPPKPSAPPHEPAGQPRRSGGASTLLAGIVGAVVALAGAGALQYAGVLPSPRSDAGDVAQLTALQGEIAALREQVQSLPAAGDAPEALAQRVNELAIALEEARAEFTAAASGQADPAAMQALDQRFAALEAAVAALPPGEGNSVPMDLAPIKEKTAALETSVAEAGRIATDAAKAAADAAAAAQAAGERIGQLEQAVAGLASRLDEQAAQPRAALAIAASALKAAIDRGEPFTTELDTFAAVAPETAEIEPLRAMAETGVPSRTDIAAEFDAAAAAMLAAGRAADPNAGFIDKLMTSAQSLVQVRPVGEVEGEDAPAAIARMEVAIDKGDYAAALREYEALPEASKAAGADYAARLRARLAADDLMVKVLAAALKA